MTCAGYHRQGLSDLGRNTLNLLITLGPYNFHVLLYKHMHACTHILCMHTSTQYVCLIGTDSMVPWILNLTLPSVSGFPSVLLDIFHLRL